jgi:hypothetical protein
MFGVTNVSNRHCTVTGCKKVATTVIGDTKYKYNLRNLFVCDEHLKELYDTLQNQFTDHSKTVDEQNNEGNTKGQTAINDYLTALYDNNGVISKAKMVEICVKHGIDIPEETPNMKTLMEMLFKDELNQEEL